MTFSEALEGPINLRPVTLSEAQLAEARAWIADCQWRDIEEEADIQTLTEKEIIRGIQRNYEGGLAAFLLAL